MPGQTLCIDSRR